MSTSSTPTSRKEVRDAYPVLVSAELVLRATKFAATNDVRYYLNGVCIKPSKSGGALVAATDGHCLLVLHDPNGKADKARILPFAKGRNDKGLSTRGADYVTVSTSDEIAVLDEDFRKRFICPEPLIDAKYPAIEAVAGTPDLYEEGVRGSVNPAYLQRAIDSAGKGHGSQVRFYHRKKSPEKSVLLFTTRSGFGVVMPMFDDAPLEKKLTKDFGGLA